MSEFPKDQRMQEAVETVVELKLKLENWIGYVAEQKGVLASSIATIEQEKILLELAYKEYSQSWMDLS